MSGTLYNLAFTAVSIVVALIMLAALVFLIVKRKPLAAAGMGLLLLGHVLGSIWPTVVPMIVKDFDIEGYRTASLIFNFVTSVIFVIGLGLVVAELFVKRPARGLEGHP